MSRYEIDRSRVCELSVTDAVSESAIQSDVVAFHADGTQLPLFLIQTWKDEIPKIQRLAALLGSDQPIYSVNPPRGQTPEDFPRRANRWVDYCTERLDPLQFTGPWRVGGWSFGGVLAAGIARTQADRGAEVELLLLMDTRFPSKPAVTYRRKNSTFLQRAVRAANEYYDTPVERRGEFMREKRKWWAVKARRKIRGESKQWLEERKERMDHLQRSLHVAYLNYEPFYSYSPAFLMWTDESRERTKDLSLGWRNYHRGPFQSRKVDGGHTTMWDEPHVETIAELVKEALAWSC